VGSPRPGATQVDRCGGDAKLIARLEKLELDEAN
jgi:hypothetical protein